MSYTAINSFRYGLDQRRAGMTEQLGALDEATNVFINEGGEIVKRKAFAITDDLLWQSDSYATERDQQRLVVTSEGLKLVSIVNTAYTDLTVLKPSAPVAGWTLSKIFPITTQWNGSPVYITESTQGGDVRYDVYKGLGSIFSSSSSYEGSAVSGMFARAFNVYQNRKEYNGGDLITITGFADNEQASGEVFVYDRNWTSNDLSFTVTKSSTNGTCTLSAIQTYTRPELINTFYGYKLSFGGTWISGDWIELVVANSGSTIITFKWYVPAACDLTTTQPEVIKAVAVHKNRILVLTNYRLYGTDPASDGTDFSGTNSLRLDLTQGGRYEPTFCGLAVYQGNLAVFSENCIQIWNIVGDVSQSQGLLQTLENVGTVSGSSIVTMGNLDVLFLDRSGIRSLRVRDSSLNAITTDIGSPVAKKVQELIDGMTDAELADTRACYEPSGGRYLLTLQRDGLLFTFALSYYPNDKVTAWTEVDISTMGGVQEQSKPRFLQDYVVYKKRLILFFHYTNDTVVDYRLGFYGTDPIVVDSSGTTKYANVPFTTNFDNCEAFVELPWLDLKSPGTRKTFGSLDLIGLGVWDVYATSDYLTKGTDNDWVFRQVATELEDPTPQMGAIPWQSNGTHCKIRLISTDVSEATISEALIHYKIGNEK